MRREESRILRERGDDSLTHTKHLWLYHPDHLPEKSFVQFEQLVRKALKTSRAWMLKELAMEMWEHRDRQAAEKIFKAWYSWAIRSRLDPSRNWPT